MSQSVPPLESLLADVSNPKYRVRWNAVQYLGESRDPRAFQPLLGALKDRLPTIRISALAALGKLRDPRAIGPAVALLGDPDSKVRTSAAAALKKFGKAAHAPMLEAYRVGNAKTRFVLLSALGRVKSPAISELLIAALDDPQADIRVEAARVLGVRKDRRAVDRLLQAVAEGGRLQHCCVRALGEIGDARAFDSLQDLLTTPDHILACEVVRALPKLDKARAVDRLLEALAEEGPHRASSVRALGEIGDARAFEPLQALLTTPDHMLGHEVVIALRKIDNPRAVDLFHEKLEELPPAERDRLARSLAGTDFLNAAFSLARKARASGDVETLAKAAFVAREALDEHRSRHEAIKNGEGTADVGDEGEGPEAYPGQAFSKAGVDVLRAFESILRDLGRGR
jgi:HEAT repeat protein